MVPLLRSIAAEIHERTCELKRLQRRLDAFGPTRRAHREEVQRLQEDLGTHRRGLRGAQRELASLGWAVDALQPIRLLRRGRNGAADLSWQPDLSALGVPADPGR